MPSKTSGGARQVRAKHLERSAKRPSGWYDDQRAAYRAATAGKVGIELAAAVAEHAARWAGDDPGMPPEQAREQQIRASLALTKASEPLREIRQLREDQRAALEVIESLETKLRAARSVPQNPRGDPATA